MATNDFQVFAGATNADVIPQASYLALPALQTGFQTGIAQSAQLNKVWRQSSILSSMIAQFIVDELGLNAVDDGTIATLEANFITALQTATNTLPITNVGLNLFVSTTGNDNNTGLSTSTAFATMPHAALIAATNYNSHGNQITVNVGPGTYTIGTNISGPLPGNGILAFVGTSGAAATSINLTAPGSCFSASTGARVSVSGFGLTASVGSTLNQGNGLVASTGSSIAFDHVIFGAAQTAHVQSTGGQIFTTGASAGAGQPYTVSGSAIYHWISGFSGLIDAFGSTITLTGTPNFSSQFASAQAGQILCPGCSFVSTATGQRFQCLFGGIINTNGGGINFLPGNSAGVNTSGYYN